MKTGPLSSTAQTLWASLPKTALKLSDASEIYWNLAKCSTDCIGIILKGTALTICRVCRIGAGATVADRLSSVRVL